MRKNNTHKRLVLHTNTVLKLQADLAGAAAPKPSRIVVCA
jgi:hypothetical protein